MTSPEARNCDLPLNRTRRHNLPGSYARAYWFEGVTIIITARRRDPQYAWKGQAGCHCYTCITRAEAARLLQWWRAQSQEAGRS